MLCFLMKLVKYVVLVKNIALGTEKSLHSFRRYQSRLVCVGYIIPFYVFQVLHYNYMNGLFF